MINDLRYYLKYYLKNYQKLFCLLKKINIKLLELSISRDKIPDFNKFKYLS